MTHILVLAGLILPLALDTFALAAALGVAGIPVERRLRTSLVLAGFEGACRSSASLSAGPSAT
jgi:hypothetical protein